MPLYIAQSGDLDRCYRCLTDWLTDWLTTLKDRATQLLINYKIGALVTQIWPKQKKSIPVQIMWSANSWFFCAERGYQIIQIRKSFLAKSLQAKCSSREEESSLVLDKLHKVLYTWYIPRINRKLMIITLNLTVVFGRIVLFDNEIKFINIEETPSIGQKATD